MPKPTLDLAVIIPTLNEGRFIGKLLDSLTCQNFLPKEVMVVDATSLDNTILEVKKYQKKLPQLRTITVPISTIAKQRNLGVAKTSAAHLLFLDADMSFKGQDVLEKYLVEVLSRKADIAAADNLPSSTHLGAFIYYSLSNFLFRLFQYFWPIATTQNLYVSREWFEKVHGFNEQIRIAEDYDFVQRVTKKGGKLIFLNSLKMYTSSRRLEKEGTGVFMLKMVVSFLTIIFFGYRKNKVEYEFGNYHSKP